MGRDGKDPGSTGEDAQGDGTEDHGEDARSWI